MPPDQSSIYAISNLSDHRQWRRRTLLATLSSIPLLSLPTLADDKLLTVDLEMLNPLAPISPRRYGKLRSDFTEPADGEKLVRRLWQAYADTGKFDYGHWAVLYSQLWWQSLPAGKGRLRVSAIARKMATKLMADNPNSAAGPFWAAAHMGFEALVRGVLDSLRMIPHFFKLLDKAEAIDPSYLMGSVYLAKAKAYIKLPSFPMSIGSLKKGFQYLEKARPLQEHTYGLWHVFYAEAEIQRDGNAAALRALEGLSKVCPTDMQSLYTYEMAFWVADKLRKAIHDGSYNRYTWDPLLQPIIELTKTRIYPPDHCHLPR